MKRADIKRRPLADTTLAAIDAAKAGWRSNTRGEKASTEALFYPNQLFFPATFNVVLRLQIGVDAEAIPTVIDDPVALLLSESFDLTNFPVISVDVVKLHLKRRMLLDEKDGFDVSIFQRFVIPRAQSPEPKQSGQLASSFLRRRRGE